MEKFQGKYRIPSARLLNWNYASRGMYFVTLCTQDRTHYFGHIIKPAADSRHFEMNLSEIGISVESEWIRTPGLRPDMNLTLGEYQVMPNHFHAILIIGENQFNTNRTNENGSAIFNSSEADIPFASGFDIPFMELISESDTQFISALENNMIRNNTFGPQSKNLGSIMRGFKSAVKMYALDHNIEFGWQPRFYDHIIRNDDEYARIANYIRNNVDNWGKDTFRH